MLRINLHSLLVLLSLTININCQTCRDGNQYQYSPCSQSTRCGCLQYSFSSSTFVCGLIDNSCSQFRVCQQPNDVCLSNEVCIRHPNCNSLQSICYPLSLTGEQACPSGIVYETTDQSNVISNYTGSLSSTDGLYTRPGSNQYGHYYEALQLYVQTSGYYDLSSISNIDTHGYLYNGSFNPSNPQLNLITYNDDGSSNSQFKIPVYLEAGHPYVLVVTTHRPGITGPFSVIADGPDNVYFYPINPTTTTTTTRAPIINSNYFNQLTSSNSFYDRNGTSSGPHYYQAIEIRVNVTGTYSFRSSSSLDTYGYIYQGNFYPFAQSINLLGQDDDTGDSRQFQVTAVLRSDIKYILVFTTFSPNQFGQYQIISAGPGHVFYNSI
ncbi:hypothetical protein I4U23_011545 [Adineta vaga]|nr:hypothetical protein I4U23_011545 [Adineta vaga]